MQIRHNVLLSLWLTLLSLMAVPLLAQSAAPDPNAPAPQPAAPPAAPPEVELIPLELNDALGRAVVRVMFKRIEEGRLINTPPEAVRRSDLARAVRVQKGVPLRRGDIEADIRDLVGEYRWFRDVKVQIEAEGADANAPLRVTYYCDDPRIASITARALVGGWITEAPPEDRFAVLAALSRQEGDRYSLDVMDRDLRERLFSGDGRYVDAREERVFREDGVHVTIIVVPAQLVDRMVMSGVFRGDRADLIEKTGLETKSHAGAATLRSIRQLIIAEYLKSGHPYVDVRHRVFKMPATEADMTVENLALVFPELNPEDWEALEDEAKPTETVLLLQVQEGPHVKVADYEYEGIERLVDIPGSDALQPGRLPSNYWPLWYALPWTERLDRVKRGLNHKLQFGPTIWTPNPDFVLEHAVQDASFLRDHLRKAGWLDASVNFVGIRSNEDRTRVTLRYSIHTGPLYVLTMLGVEITTQPRPNDPLGAKGEKVPQAVSFEDIFSEVPYDFKRIDKDRAAEVGLAGFESLELDEPVTYSIHRWEGEVGETPRPPIIRQIRNRFGKLGYSNVNIRIEPQFFDGSTKLEGVPPELLNQPDGVRPVVLRIFIDQRQKYRVGEIMIRGNLKTKTSVIRRQLRLFPGELYDIELVEHAADRLRLLGWFDATAPGRGVQIQAVFRSESIDPNSELLDADLVVEVIEGQTGSANFAATYAPGVGFAINLSLTKRNFDIANWSDFTGAGQSLSFEVEPPIAQRQRYTLSFGEPFLFGYPVSSDFRVSFIAQDFGPYTRDERGGRIGLGYQLKRDLSLILAYQNFRNEILDVDDTAAFEIRRDEGVTTFAALSLELVHNSLNRYLFPSRGNKLSVETLAAGEPFGGNVNLWRLTGEATSAYLIAELDESRDFTFSLHGISVYQQPWGATNRIPIAQRLFLGSLTERTAMRGYEPQGIGPSSEGDGIGGNFYVNATAQANLEAVSGFFWLVGFVDAGELVPELENFDPSGIAVSAGFGLRIKLPLFPLPFGLDFGWPIYDQPGTRRQVVAINLTLTF